MSIQKDSPSFLIVKMSSLGDIIQCFCVIDYLIYKYPKATIDWVVEKPFEDLLRSHPLVDRVIVAQSKKWRKNLKSIWEIIAFRKQLRQRRYDAIFDLQGNCKSGLTTFFSRGRDKVGYKPGVVPEWPNLLVTNTKFPIDTTLQINEQYLSLVKQYFKDEEKFIYDGVRLCLADKQREKIQGLFSFPSPIFMICPGSNWRNKRLSEKTLIEFLGHLKKEFKASFLFVFGSREEEIQALSLQSRFCDRSAMIGFLDFALWQHIMTKVGCVISMDSSSLHLCATTKTPSFSIFGPSSAEVYRPYGEKHFAFQGTCPYGEKFTKRCSILRTCETGACIRDISASTLSKVFTAWWSKVKN